MGAESALGERSGGTPKIEPKATQQVLAPAGDDLLRHRVQVHCPVATGQMIVVTIILHEERLEVCLVEGVEVVLE
jgi:hypothetical protein